MIHVIDQVLTPPLSILRTAVELNLGEVVAAAVKANLTSELLLARDVTVFVPTDEAFGDAVERLDAAALANVLSAHGKSLKCDAADQG